VSRRLDAQCRADRNYHSVVDPLFEADAPDLEAWQAWHPREAALILTECPVPWYVAGGWAIDLSLGRETREHEDLEIAISRVDFAAYRAFIVGLDRFDLYDAGSGRVSRLADGQEPNQENHQIWMYERDAHVWRMDTFLEPRDARTWVSRRDPRIQVPMADAVRRTAEGIRYLAPALVLFMKAKHARDKDDLDLTVTLPTLDQTERRWLADSIDLVHPSHRWSTTVDGQRL
jgi:Aminoglycoside-2''-adenylyltransferase